MAACIVHSARQPRLIHKHYDNLPPVPSKHHLIAPQPSINTAVMSRHDWVYTAHTHAVYLQLISELPPAACQILPPLIAQEKQVVQHIFRRHSENIVLHSSRQSAS
jgi:hypothetical protein